MSGRDGAQETHRLPQNAREGRSGPEVHPQSARPSDPLTTHLATALAWMGPDANQAITAVMTVIKEHRPT